MIQAQVVAHSVDPRGNELVSILATFPRIILAEVNTHRMLSKNTSSSRAIPFNKMVESVLTNPFIPIAWQTHHKGMQGTEYLTTPIDVSFANDVWLEARDRAVKSAKALYDGTKVTKQLANRLLEPFMWTTMLVTGNLKDGGWDNFFELRCPAYEFNGNVYKSKKDVIESVHKPFRFKVSESEFIEYKDVFSDKRFWQKINKGQAEIHITALAESIYDAIDESTPEQLQPGQWHIPFKDSSIIADIDKWKFLPDYPNLLGRDISHLMVKVSTAIAARTSYTVVGDEKGIDYQKMIELHDRLIAQNPPHSSPMEHCARVMTEYENYNHTKRLLAPGQDFGRGIEHTGWCRNFRGFIPYRQLLELNAN